MSDTEMGESILPPPNTFVADVNGITRWRPQFDAIRIEPGFNGGRQIRVVVAGDIVAQFELDPAAAAALAARLSPNAGGA